MGVCGSTSVSESAAVAVAAACTVGGVGSSTHHSTMPPVCVHSVRPHTCFLACPPAAVGGIMGFALVFAGSEGVVWYKRRSTFPYVEGFVPVVLSWFISPLAAAASSALLFWLTRLVVLRRQYTPRLGMLVGGDA